MWLCFNDGFLSVVADKNNPASLLVRARRKQDLLNVCGKDVEVLKDAGTDYRWRTFVDRKAFSALVAARIDKIDYTNFKNSVKDHDLHGMYMDFWSRHYRYQEQEKEQANRR
jgi:hypothetical protein